MITSNDVDAMIVGELLRESAVIRLMYTRKSSGKLWVQRIELKINDLERRLFDVILVSWGQSAIRGDLEFVMALDEDGGILTTVEGLTHYVAHSMSEAQEEFKEALRTEIGNE